MKYTTAMKKEQILEIIVKEFESRSAELDEEWTDVKFGRYDALRSILSQVHILEKEA